MWPNSPVNPLAPTTSRPPATMPPPMPVPERDHHHVVDAAPGADGPLGERGARGVVADRDGPAESLGEAAGDVELDHVGHVRRRLQHAVERDQPGQPDADRASTAPAPDSRSPTIAASTSISASPPRGVGSRVSATSAPSASMTTPRHFVPPTSMPRCRAGHPPVKALGAGLQLAHRVEDAHLGPPLDEAGQRRRQLDGQVVAHLGAAVGRRA